MLSEQIEDSSSVLVLLLGLPASGKTSLARTLAASSRRESHVSIVSYDEQLRLLSPSDAPFSADIWKRNRDVCVGLCKSQLSTPVSPGGLRQVVVVDDNMQLFSMRKEVYKLARDVRCAFVQVYLSCPLELSLELNRKRDTASQVPDSVIRKMYQAFDVPRPDIHSWEVGTIIIETQALLTSSIDPSRILDEALDKSNVPPLQQKESVETARCRQLAGQESNSKSIAHTYDVWSRNLLSKTMKILGDTVTERAFLTSVGNHLNAERRVGLDTLRTKDQHDCEVLLQHQELFVSQCNQAIGTVMFTV